MTNDLAQAYHGVYTSSGEIMKNKQRHLYVNMIDLLTRTTRASGVSSSILLKDQHVKFWYSEILSLVFDEDSVIRDNAITALETVLSYFEAVEFYNAPEWPGIKATIVEHYSRKLHDLREASDSNWYKIWCILVRILNKEILKGASVINTFLQIVELGFRSSDYNIRAEAFLCWKVLVEIFAKHDEICSPKRIKLICIPLKSSQSKTMETSVNKFKVWWFFICKLSLKIEDYLDTIYEPFLVFCFGPSCKQQSAVVSSATAQGKMYMIVRQMAIACLIESLGAPCKDATSVMNSVGLEHATMPLITKSIMLKCGKTVINACFEATIMERDPGTNHGKQIETLWKNLHMRLIETQDLELYHECFKQLNVMCQTEHFKAGNILLRQHMLYIIELIADPNEFPFGSEINNINKFCEILNLFTELIANANINIPQRTMNRITEIYSLKNFVRTAKYWPVQKNVMQFLLNNCKIQENVKINLWKNVSHSLAEYLQKNLFEFQLVENAKLLNDWILWPLQSDLLETKGAVNEDFFICWKHLMKAVAIAEGKSALTQNLVISLRCIFDSEIRSAHFPLVVGHLIMTLDNSFDASSKPTTAFEFINYILSVPARMGQGSYTKIIEYLITYLSKIGDNQVIEAFNELKAIFTTVIAKENSGAFDKRTVDDFKRTFQDKLKSHKAKEKKLLKEIKDLMKNDSMFVIIPTVWGMNPDKLTEHQKEKMKEKRSDIPALYNDMSQSQDTSIKPWTPKKIVIAKVKDSGEIVIENKNEHTIVSSEETDNTALSTYIQHNHIEPSSEADVDQSWPVNNIHKSNNISGDQPHTKADKRMEDNAPKIYSNNENATKKALKTNERENILNKLNIQVDDEEKKLHLLRQLKSIEIDTVEGNTLVTGKLRERRSLSKPNATVNKRKNSTQSSASKRTRTCNHNKGKNIEATEKNDVNFFCKNVVFENEYLKEEKQEKFLNQDEQADGNDSTDDIIEASQISESVLTKKTFKKKLIASNKRSDSPVKNKVYEHKNAEIDNILPSESSPQYIRVQQEFHVVDSGKEIHQIMNNEEVSKQMALQNNNITPTIPKNGKPVSISEMDTEPNTEIMDQSSLNAISKAIYPKEIELSDQHNTKIMHSPQIDQLSTSIISDKLVPIAPTIVLDEKQNSSTSDLNHSIRSSSECKEFEERVTEFMNNTLDISPILNGNHDGQKSVNIELDKTPTSPINRKSTKLSTQLQLSPPERKPTNNAESPAHRPKVPPQFTGRGAKLINLIRNKPTECAPKQQVTLMTANIEEKIVVEQAIPARYPQQSPPKSEQAPVPVHKDLLVFSKTLPSPHASPSASILKRKLRRDSFDDIDSPFSKRKRVSFHDPPVSITKEYLKHDEEDRAAKPSFNRCLLPDRSSTPNNSNFKYNTFKRKSRADSMVEIAKFSDLPAQISEIDLNFGSNRNVQFGQTSVEMDSLKWNATSENDQQEIDEACLTPSPSLYFSDDNAVLKYVLKKYSLERLFENYSQTDKALTNKSIRAVAKELCSLMSKDTKTKSNVLEILSERYPQEFLEHAVQENLSFVVCEKLNYSSIVEYVCEKSKLNEDSRRILLERIQTLLSADKLNADARQLIVSLLKNHRMTDQEIVSCMEIIISRHGQNKRTLAESL